MRVSNEVIMGEDEVIDADSVALEGRRAYIAHSRKTDGEGTMCPYALSDIKAKWWMDGWMHGKTSEVKYSITGINQ